jgi:hypothetical protein
MVLETIPVKTKVKSNKNMSKMKGSGMVNKDKNLFTHVGIQRVWMFHLSLFLIASLHSSLSQNINRLIQPDLTVPIMDQTDEFLLTGNNGNWCET